MFILTEELKRIYDMKVIYEKQIESLEYDWENGNSRFANIKDYQIQLNTWAKRVAQYEDEIIKLGGMTNK